MTDVTVHFVRPIDERVITVTLDGTMTARDAIAELLANDFVPPSPFGYELTFIPPNSDGNQSTTLRGEQTLADAGVTSNTKLRVNPATNAGAQMEAHQ